MTPADIRIADLREPVLSEVQQGAIDYCDAHPVSMTQDAVLSAATEMTGLDDFGPDDFRPRLDLWLDEVGGDPNRTELGKRMIYDFCVRHAANRLRIHALWQAHPEIDEVPITRPIIVAGLPRSGTTHLLNLLSADRRLHSLPLWESYEPVPGPNDAEHDGRYDRAAQAWDAMQAVAPELAAMHPMDPDHIHEEIELQCPDFSSYTLEWMAHVPGRRDHYLAHDQTPHYAYLRRVLQAITWLRAERGDQRDRWVLKSPQHFEQLGPLMATFPDAVVVTTHRDPVSVVQSAATMLTYGARTGQRHVDADATFAYWADRIERLLRACVDDLHLVPEDRRVDVLFHEFMADDAATVARIYEASSLELTDAARREIADHLTAHPRGRFGRVVYDLRADFRAEPEAVREPFAFYTDRFPVEIEVR